MVHTELPDESVVPLIVADSLRGLAAQWPELASLAEDTAVHRRVGKLLTGLDGRRIRKTVHGALALRLETAREPALLSVDDLVAAAEEAATARP